MEPEHTPEVIVNDPSKFPPVITLSGKETDHFVTADYCYIEGDKFYLLLDKDLDLPGDFADNISKIINALEEKSGLTFMSAGNRKVAFEPIKMSSLVGCNDPWESIDFGKKVPIYVFMGQENISSANDKYVSLIYYESSFDYYELVHELTHTLTLRNSKNSKTIAEGTADYFVEPVLNELKYVSNEIKMNYENLLDIYRFEENMFYEQYKDLVTPANAENIFLDDFSSLSMIDREPEYIFGRILCNFLAEKYGEDFLLDFFTAVNASEIDIYYNRHTVEDMEEYVNVFKNVFGSSVFKQFGTWYQENAGRIH